MTSRGPFETQIFCDSHLEDCVMLSLIGQDAKTKSSTYNGSEHRLMSSSDTSLILVSLAEPNQSDVVQSSIALEMNEVPNMNVARGASPFT